MNVPLAAGFADPVHDAQRAFRAALDALARPGQVVDLGEAIAGLAIQPAMAHLLLALTDDDTSVWWQRNDAAAAQWLRFHTGATVAGQADHAAFAAQGRGIHRRAAGPFDLDRGRVCRALVGDLA